MEPWEWTTWQHGNSMHTIRFHLQFQTLNCNTWNELTAYYPNRAAYRLVQRRRGPASNTWWAKHRVAWWFQTRRQDWGTSRARSGAARQMELQRWTTAPEWSCGWWWCRRLWRCQPWPPRHRCSAGGRSSRSGRRSCSGGECLRGGELGDGPARTASSTAMEERRRRRYGESRESVTAAEKRLTWGFRWAGLQAVHLVTLRWTV